jgi:hypothetical protein
MNKKQFTFRFKILQYGVIIMKRSGCCPFKLTVACVNITFNNERNIITKRYFIDCRDYPGDVKCTLALSVDIKEVLLEAVVQHGINVHGFEGTPELKGTDCKRIYRNGASCLVSQRLICCKRQLPFTEQ